MLISNFKMYIHMHIHAHVREHTHTGTHLPPPIGKSSLIKRDEETYSSNLNQFNSNISLDTGWKKIFKPSVIR